MITLSQSSARTRREFLKSSSFFLTAAVTSATLPHSLFSQAPDDSPRIDALRKQLSGTIQVTKLSGGVSMLSGAGGNIGILTGPEGKIVIDSGVSLAAPGILQAFAQIDSSPLKYLINTHWHFDHTDGNLPLHDAGATVVASEKTRDRLSNPQFLAPLNLHFPAAPEKALPTRTLSSGFTFYHGGEEVILQTLPPAHTDTDLFVYFKQSDVLHAGDVFFNGTYPLIDYSTDGNISGFVDGMRKIGTVAKDSTKIIPGHGPLASKSDFIATHDALATIRDRVAAAKKSGKSLEETIASKPTADFDPKLGKGFIVPDMFVTMAYQTLP